MSKQRKTLSLHRETIVHLTQHELGAAHGGTTPAIPIVAASLEWCVAAAVPVAGALEKVREFANWRTDKLQPTNAARARTTFHNIFKK